MYFFYFLKEVPLLIGRHVPTPDSPDLVIPFLSWEEKKKIGAPVWRLSTFTTLRFRRSAPHL